MGKYICWMVKLIRYLTPSLPAMYSAYVMQSSACGSCPLVQNCPLRFLPPIIVYSIFLALINKIEEFTKIIRTKLDIKKLKTLLKFTALLIMLISVISSSLVSASPGVDELYVEPKEIKGYVNDVVTVKITVKFRHPQPCPYPDWKITYELMGDAEVIEESDVELISRLEAVKTLKIKILGNGTLRVIYKYGRGCPFGKEEVAEVPIIGLAKVTTTTPTTTTAVITTTTTPTPTTISTTPVTTPATSTTPTVLTTSPTTSPTTTTSPVTKVGINIVEVLYEGRTYIYILLFLIMIASMVILTRQGNMKLVNGLRYLSIALVIILLVLLPIFYVGVICPCPLVIPQYIVLIQFLMYMPFIYIVMIAIAIVSSLVLKRGWCGWICPLGFIQDVLSKAYGKVKVKFTIDKVLKYIKYVILAILVIAVASTLTPYLCINCFIVPITTSIYSRSFPTVTFTQVLLAIGLIMILLSIMIPRFFCRYICPAGALLELISKISLFRLRRSSKCMNCKVCIALSKCPMNLKEVGSTDCISCFKCVGSCPFKAIELRG